MPTPNKDGSVTYSYGELPAFRLELPAPGEIIPETVESVTRDIKACVALGKFSELAWIMERITRADTLHRFNGHHLEKITTSPSSKIVSAR